MNNQSNKNKANYVFFGYEALYGRVGLDLTLEDMTLDDETKRIEELTQIYKDKWGYEDVLIRKCENDPYMVLVYVRPNQPYSTTFYDKMNIPHAYVPKKH